MSTPLARTPLIESLESRRLLSGLGGEGGGGFENGGGPVTLEKPQFHLQVERSVVDEEGDRTVTFFLDRGDILIDKHVTAEVQVLAGRHLDGTAPAEQGADFGDPSKMSISLPAHVRRDEFTVEIKNDDVAEPAEPGGPAAESFALAFVPKETDDYEVVDDPAFVSITDGTGWYVDKEWTEQHTPMIMRTPTEFVGRRDVVTMHTHHVYRLYSYDKFEPIHAWDSHPQSGTFEDADNDILWQSSSLTLTETQNYGANFNLNLDGSYKGVGASFGVDYQGESGSTGVSKPISERLRDVEFGPDEWGIAIALIKKRYVIETEQVFWRYHTYNPEHKVRLEETQPETKTSEKLIGYVDDMDYGAWFVKRHWLDPDDGQTTSKTAGLGIPPINMQSLFAAAAEEDEDE